MSSVNLLIMETLIKYLDSMQPLSAGLTEHLQRTLKEKIVSPGDFLLKSGQVSRDIFFIEKGLMRMFYPWKNHVISSWFRKEGDIIASPASFFTQTPGYENIEVLEPGVVYYVTFDELSNIYTSFPEFNYHRSTLLEKYYVQSQRHNFILHTKSAEERYMLLKQYDPELLKRVEDRYIASYLGISPFTFSRTKKKFAKLAK